MKKKKILEIIIFSVAIILIVTSIVILVVNNGKTDSVITDDETKLKELPKPEITGGARGELGIDKNINEETIDEYLNRPDSVYRDMRMLEDTANYEAIGGDRYLSGYIKGFEVVPLPYIIPVTGLPSEVGETYTGTTLFYDDNGTYKANYKESMSIIEELFPKDKVIFLMCGGGGYAGMTKNFLISLGWDADKIYNVGGHWYYKGKNNITVKKEVDGVITYDFDKVPYHNIDFDKLTKSDDYKSPEIKVTEVKISTSKLDLEEGNSFQLNAIVLPNEATNKEVKWTSSNESIATVNDGLVRAVGAGTAVVTVESIDGNKTITCEVTVKKKKPSTRVTLDDLSSQIWEFNSYDMTIINKEFENLVNDPVTHTTKSEFLDENGRVNDLWKEASAKYTERIEKAHNKRVEILKDVISNNKTFIIVVKDSICSSTYTDVLETIVKVLNENNYSCFVHGSLNEENTLYEVNLNTEEYKYGSIIIVKDGKIYATSDPNSDSLKNDEDIKNWLSRYIEI